MGRMWRLFAVALFIALLAPVMAAAPAMAAGLCFGATGTSDKIYVDKDSTEVGFNFDLARGDAYVGWMNPCVGAASFPTGMGSWVLLANLEDNDRSPAPIVQIGYGKGCSLCDDMYVYTPGGYGAGVEWPGTLVPVAGHRVRAVIERTTDPDTGRSWTKFTIRDITTGVQQSYSVSGWAGGYDKAWWGVEALDTSSEVAPDASGPDTNMAYMGYSTTDSGSIIYRSGMRFHSCYCESGPPYDSPSSIEKQGGTSTSEHGHLGDWVYGDDMVNFESH